MHLTEADKALARQFAGQLESRPAGRPVDELTAANLREIDRQHAGDALQQQVHTLRCLGGL
jgi:hypothetical protein